MSCTCILHHQTPSHRQQTNCHKNDKLHKIALISQWYWTAVSAASCHSREAAKPKHCRDVAEPWCSRGSSISCCSCHVSPFPVTHVLAGCSHSEGLWVIWRLSCRCWWPCVDSCCCWWPLWTAAAAGDLMLIVAAAGDLLPTVATVTDN